MQTRRQSQFQHNASCLMKSRLVPEKGFGPCKLSRHLNRNLLPFPDQLGPCLSGFCSFGLPGPGILIFFASVFRIRRGAIGFWRFFGVGTPCISFFLPPFLCLSIGFRMVFLVVYPNVFQGIWGPSRQGCPARFSGRVKKNFFKKFLLHRFFYISRNATVLERVNVSSF